MFSFINMTEKIDLEIFISIDNPESPSVKVQHIKERNILHYKISFIAYNIKYNYVKPAQSSQIYIYKGGKPTAIKLKLPY